MRRFWRSVQWFVHRSQLSPTTMCPDGEKHILRCIRCELPAAGEPSPAPQDKLRVKCDRELAKASKDALILVIRELEARLMERLPARASSAPRVDLEAIKARLREATRVGNDIPNGGSVADAVDIAAVLAFQDIPALIAEVESWRRAAERPNE